MGHCNRRYLGQVPKLKIHGDIKESLERKDSGKNTYHQKASINPKKKQIIA